MQWLEWLFHPMIEIFTAICVVVFELRYLCAAHMKPVRQAGLEWELPTCPPGPTWLDLMISSITSMLPNCHAGGTTAMCMMDKTCGDDT